MKIIQPKDANHHRLKRGRYRWFSGVCKVRFPIGCVTMYLGVKRPRNLLRCATECDPVTPPRDVGNCKSLRLQPRLRLVNVAWAKAEFVRVLLGREPAMVVWRQPVLLFGQQLLQIRLLCRSRLEGQSYQVECARRIEWPLVEFGLCLWVDISF